MMTVSYKFYIPERVKVENIFTRNVIFIPCHLKSAGYYGIPSVQKFVLSVRPLSVCHYFISALSLEYFLTDFLQTLYKS